MALTFICNNCGEDYNARSGLRSIKYTDRGGAEHEVSRDDDPCYQCDEAAEKAKEEALAMRRKT
jgi:hypothetical protein